VRQQFGGPHAVAGPNALQFITPVELRGTPELTTVGEFTVAAGETVPFTMSWYPSHHRGFAYRDPCETLLATETQWLDWSSHCTLQGKWRDAIIRSLITLRMLTYRPTGGIVAAPTTSLPEWIGSVRNWDYRYCWIRDATLTLYALLSSGYRGEARARREWLLRAAAGHPSEMQIMYGLAGERRLTEYEVEWLPGYEGSRPVRIGNAAYQQLQLDVYGELSDALYACRRYGLESNPDLEHVARTARVSRDDWQQPDQGMWEIRGEPRHFTFSKIMAWVAFDRAIKGVEQFGLDGTRAHWEELRATIAAEILDKAYDPERNTFVQYYGARDLDASLLLIPLLGFLPPEDPRVHGTVAAIERERCKTGWSTGIRAGQAPTACRPAKAFSSPAASGWRIPWRGSGGATKPWLCSSGCSICAMISACCQRNTTRSPSASSAISRKPSRTPRSSTRRRIWPSWKPPPRRAATTIEEQPRRIIRAGIVRRNGCL
jgi:GH15 family glucan-1,4-alpha-glucosidase